MVAIQQSIACSPSGNAALLSGDYTTSNLTYRFNSSDESITYTNGTGWEDLGSNRPFSLSSATGASITLGMGWGNIVMTNPYNVNGVEVGYSDPASSNNNPPAPLSTGGTQKKVFCNFW